MATAFSFSTGMFLGLETLLVFGAFGLWIFNGILRDDKKSCITVTRKHITNIIVTLFLSAFVLFIGWFLGIL